MISAILRRMYKYHFVSECFDIDSIMDDVDRKFLKCCFPQSTVCILYSRRSKTIHMGSVLETTTFSSQCATILVASLLLYVVIVLLLSSLPVFFHACSSVYFTFSTIAVPLLLTHDLRVRLLRVCSMNSWILKYCFGRVERMKAQDRLQKPRQV